MAKGYQIGVGVDTKAAKQAIDAGLVDPLEDAQKELTELGKNKGPDQLERGLRDAQKESKDLKKETERTADAIEKEYKRAYREAKESAERGMGGASEATGEFKQEFKQNLSEVTSSFDGSMSSMQDLAQGTFGGLASGLAGPLGVAAAGAAVSVGLVGAAFEAAQEKQEKLEAAASDWADAYIEAGGRIISAAQQVAMYNEIATDPEKYKEATKNSELWGVSLGVAMNAMAGNTWAVDEAQASLNKRHDEFAAKLGDRNQKVLDDSEALTGWRKAIQDGQDALDGITGAMDLGAAQADAYSESLRLMAENTAGATKTVDEFGDLVYTLPDETQVYVDAETGKATQSLEAMEKKIYGLPDAEVKIDLSHNADDTIASMHRKLAQANLQMRIKLKDQYGRDL